MKNSGVQLGAIADDFTGATDFASILARSRQPVSLRIGASADPPADPSPYEVIVLKTRTSPVAEATAEALAALEWLQAAGAERYFWKYCSTFDSTPVGNIGPVAEAPIARLGTGRPCIARRSPRTDAPSTWATYSSETHRSTKAR